MTRAIPANRHRYGNHFLQRELLLAAGYDIEQTPKPERCIAR